MQPVYGAFAVILRIRERLVVAVAARIVGDLVSGATESPFSLARKRSKLPKRRREQIFASEAVAFTP
jgi:hypothetical protein